MAFDLLFKGVTIVTMDDDCPELKNAYLGIEGRKITWLSTEAPTEPATRTIENSHLVLMPGLYNTHTHLGMSVLRGYADEYTLDVWLNQHIWPAEAKLSREAIAAASALSVAEAIASGTVSFTDMYFHMPDLAEFMLKAGCMGNLTNSPMCFTEVYDKENDRAWQEINTLYRDFHNADGRIKADASIHAEYTSNPGVWELIAGFAKERGLNIHLHLSETKKEHDECVQKYGITPAALFAKHGVFDNRTTAAHCVAVTDEDIEILRDKGVTAVHDPGSNLKLASGVQRTHTLLERGVNVSLATDSACAINTNDLFFELKLAAILHKGVDLEPTRLPAAQVLKMATKNGAFSQGREAESGVLKVGMDADLIAVDMDKPHLIPCHSVVSNLVYAARGSDVCMTLCKGKVLYEQGEWKTLDIERIKYDMIHTALPCLKG